MTKNQARATAWLLHLHTKAPDEQVKRLAALLDEFEAEVALREIAGIASDLGVESVKS